MKTLQLNTDDFALTTNVLSIMQESYKLVQALTNVFGSRFVISGCEENAGVIASGIVCIDGEVMTTDGGVASNQCKVNSVTTTKNIQDGSYEYVEKTLEFTSGGDFSWSTVKRISDLIDNINTLNNDTSSLDARTTAVEAQTATLAKYDNIDINIVSGDAGVLNVNYKRINRAGNIYAIQASFEVAFGSSVANEELEFDIGIADILDIDVAVEIDGVKKIMTVSNATPLRLQFSEVYSQETIEVVINAIILG